MESTVDDSHRRRFEFIDAHVHFYDLAHSTLRYSWLEPDFIHPAIGNIDAIKTYRYLLDDFTAETRFAGVVGRENVIAGADCGFGTFAGSEEIQERIVWAKLEALVQGARIASARLW